MQTFYIGTGMVIGGVSLMMPVILLLGFSKMTAGIVGMSISTIGFIIQMYAMFSIRASFEQESKLLEQKHEAVMEKVKTLPPEEAIELLLSDK